MTTGSDQNDVKVGYASILSQKPDKVLVRTGHEVRERSTDDFLSSDVNPTIDMIPVCCLFSMLAYAPDSRIITVKKKDKKEEEKKLIVPENWEEITALPDINATYKAETGRKTYAGLTYRIFKNTTNRTLIIAFRGSTAEIGDWLTNARWVTRVNPFHDDHYNVIQDQIHNLINFACKDLDSKNQDDIRIITTGHSLGGGLASNAAYASAIIKEVVAINTSPVTGFYNIPVGQRIRQKKNIHIARIFEHGEILAFFRLPLRVLYRLSKKDPAIIEARFNFGIRKSSIKEHSLLEFADAIWKTKYGNSIFPD